MNDKLIETIGGYSWPYTIKDDGTAEIAGKPSPAPEGTLAIPEKLGGRIVTRIGDEAFADCGELNEGHDCICITAYSSNREKDDGGVHKRGPRVSNHAANNALGAVLRKMGYSVTKVVGKYPEKGGQSSERENGWLVVNVNDDLDFLVVCAGLAEADEQDGILVIPNGCSSSGRGCYFYGTKNAPDAWVGYHERKEAGISINGDAAFEASIGGKRYCFNIVDKSDEDEFWNPSSMYGAQARHAYIKSHYGLDFFNVKGTE